MIGKLLQQSRQEQVKCNDSVHGIGEISKDLNGQGLAGMRGWWMLVVKKGAK